MFWETKTESFIPKKKARIPEIKIVKIIDNSWETEIVSSIFKIAAADPVLDFCMEKIVMNERAMTIVFIIPTKKRKDSGEEDSLELEISEATIAACPEPKPGRNDEKGAVKDAAKVERNICFFDREIFESRDCFGRAILFFRETKRVERPKRPDNNGRRGFFIGR